MRLMANRLDGRKAIVYKGYMFHPLLIADFGTPWLVWDLFWDGICAGVMYSFAWGMWTTFLPWFA